MALPILFYRGFPPFVPILFLPIFAVFNLKLGEFTCQSFRQYVIKAVLNSIIALSLIGFLLMDSRTGTGKLFGE